MRLHKRHLRLLIGATLAVLTYATIRIVIARSNSDTTQALSAIENMGQDALAARIIALKETEDAWTSAKMWAGSIAAFLALSALIFEVVENRATSTREVAEGRLTSLIRRNSDLAIAQAKAQASSADARAGEANENAARAGVRAAEASKEAADATLLAKRYEADIASSNAQAAEARSMAKGFEATIAEANRAAAEAGAIAEKERVARLQLELRLAPRALSSQQSQQMTSALAPFKGSKIDTVVWGNVPEMERIAQAIASNLSKASWEIGGFEIAMGGAGNVQGILVGVQKDADPNTQRAAATLVSVLRSFGIDAGSWDFDQMPFPGTSTGNGVARGAPIKLFVGNKP